MVIFGAATLVMLPTTAQALSKSDDCTAGGDDLSATTVYYSSNLNWFVDYDQFTIDGNTASFNNVYKRLRHQNGSPTYWAWTSGDNIKGGQTYTIDSNAYAPKSAYPYMKTNAIFDQVGGDPNCSTYVNL